MMFTHDQMLSAVRSAGENGRPFTCGAVRDCLGVRSGDKDTMNLFHRRFRTFQKEAAGEIEKVGKNAYRLRNPEPAKPAQLVEPIEVDQVDAIAPFAPIEVDQVDAIEPIKVEQVEMIEIDFDVQDLPKPSIPPESLLRAADKPMVRAWLERGQRLGRRVVGLFGRA